ncbi:MAG: hypothetical protein SFX18_13350 [Pirellulales bacterium]|nr:hypothetical protein [Pirellulales bacterium]
MIPNPYAPPQIRDTLEPLPLAEFAPEPEYPAPKTNWWLAAGIFLVVLGGYLAAVVFG